MKRSCFSSLVPWVIGLAVLAGCGDEDTTDPDNSQGQVDATTQTAIWITDVTSTTALATSGAEFAAGLLGDRPPSAPGHPLAIVDTLFRNIDCPLITLRVEQSAPMVLTMDYGTGCTSDLTGRTASGSVAATIQTGPSLTLAFDDYTVEGVELDGTFSSSKSDGTYNWTIDGTATEDGKTVEADMTLTATVVRGEVGDVSDDVWTVSGTGTLGTDQYGQIGFTIRSNDPVVFPVDCGYPTSGTIEVTVQGQSGTCDCGDGACDSIVHVQIGPISRDIDLSDL